MAVSLLDFAISSVYEEFSMSTFRQRSSFVDRFLFRRSSERSAGSTLSLTLPSATGSRRYMHVLFIHFDITNTTSALTKETPCLTRSLATMQMPDCLPLWYIIGFERMGV